MLDSSKKVSVTMKRYCGYLSGLIKSVLSIIRTTGIHHQLFRLSLACRLDLSILNTVPRNINNKYLQNLRN